MKKQLLVNAYFSKNVGDDLFLKILIDRYPHVNWELLTADKDYLDVFKDYKNVKIINSYRNLKIGSYHLNLFFLIHKFLIRYKKYDAIINIGGSIFMQGVDWKTKLSERNYLISRFKSKKNFIIGANFGPFQDQHFLRKHQELFAKYDDVCFRDSSSYHLFKGLGNVRLAPDVVLSFQDQQIKKLKKTVGISTINLEERVNLKKYTIQYNEKITQLVERYIESGYQIKLFSFCENEGDLAGIRKIQENIDPQYVDKISIVRYTGDLLLFLESFKSCERIIGTRFHSLILAMIYDQPFYPLIYSEKTSNFLADLGLENEGCKVKDIEYLKVKEFLSLKHFITMKDQQLFSDANKQFEKLDEFLSDY